MDISLQNLFIMSHLTSNPRHIYSLPFFSFNLPKVYFLPTVIAIASGAQFFCDYGQWRSRGPELLIV